MPTKSAAPTDVARPEADPAETYGLSQSPWMGLRSALSFKNISAVYLLVLMVAIFAIWIPDLYFTTQNVQAVLFENSVATLIAIGLCLPLAAGVFDLSVGANAGVASVLVGKLVIDQGMSWPLAVVVTVAFGAIVGVVNGLIVVKFKVDSLIATLAMMSVLTGLGSAIGKDEILAGFPAGFSDFGSAEFLGLAYPVWIMLIVAVFTAYVLDRTVAGRRIRATGGSRDVARLAGIRTDGIVIWTMSACGAIAALAGVLATARISAAQFTLGPPYLLPAFAAVFLGATQLKNGRFNVWGTVLASFMLAFSIRGFLLGGAPSYLSHIFNGVALAVAVGLSTYSRERLPKQKRKEKGDRPSDKAADAASETGNQT